MSFQETDFVCFDTGFDRFNNYDIDLLLGSSVQEDDSENKGTSDQSQVSENAQEETQPSEDEAADSETQTKLHDSSEDLDKVPDDQSASLTEPEVETESPFTENVETEAATERAAEDTEVVQENQDESVLENVLSETSKTKDMPAKSEAKSLAKVDVVSENDPVSVSEEVKIPELKTTLGTTFDAVTTDEDITKNVTPYEEEESEYVDDPPEEDVNVVVGTPLLPFSEEKPNTPASDPLKEHQSPPTTAEHKPETAEEKNMWTTFGDAVFAVVTGGETTAHDMSSEEDDDEEEEAALKTTQHFEEAKKDMDKLVSIESPKDPEKEEPVRQDPPFNFVQTDNEEANSDSEADGEVIGPEDTWDETLKPTEESTIPVDLVSQEDTSAVLEAQQSDVKTADEPFEHEEEEEEEVFKDSEDNHDAAGIQDSHLAKEQHEDFDSELAENETATDQELAGMETETHLDPFAKEISDVNSDEKTTDDRLPNQTHDHLVTDLESNNSQPELPVEEPEIHEELPTEEFEQVKDTEKEEEKEELLDDENALFSSQSNDTDSAELSPEDTLPTVSTPEPEYSDSVLRLTILRDHFTEEKMERIQKLLGLVNLFRVEAMFSDLDIEMQATRLSHTGTTQDIENALEGILEASENTILDEIEKMLDGQGTKHHYNQHMETDEETEILDDFQELAFSLRQKYSTASDSTPLATEKASSVDQGSFDFIIFI